MKQYKHQFYGIAWKGLVERRNLSDYNAKIPKLTTFEASNDQIKNIPVRLQHGKFEEHIVGIVDKSEIKNNDLHLWGRLSDEGKSLVKGNDNDSSQIGVANSRSTAKYGLSLGLEVTRHDEPSPVEYIVVKEVSICRDPVIYGCKILNKFSHDDKSEKIFYQTKTFQIQMSTATPTDPKLNNPPSGETPTIPTNNNAPTNTQPVENKPTTNEKPPTNDNKTTSENLTPEQFLDSVWENTDPSERKALFMANSSKANEILKQRNEEIVKQKREKFEKIKSLKDFIEDYNEKEIEEDLFKINTNPSHYDRYIKMAERVKNQTSQSQPQSSNQNQGYSQQNQGNQNNNKNTNNDKNVHFNEKPNQEKRKNEEGGSQGKKPKSAQIFDMLDEIDKYFYRASMTNNMTGQKEIKNFSNDRIEERNRDNQRLATLYEESEKVCTKAGLDPQEYYEEHMKKISKK
jgi:hypothetical protein